MPATEETYRRQPTLHIIFAISSIAMTLAIIWMIMADHLRPWKQVQREFQVVEREKLEGRREAEAREEQKAKYQNQIDEIDGRSRRPSRRRPSARPRPEPARQGAQGTRRQRPRSSTPQRKFKKAELDSQRSLYDGMIERGEEREARVYLNTTVAKAEQQLLDADARARGIARPSSS